LLQSIVRVDATDVVNLNLIHNYHNYCRQVIFIKRILIFFISVGPAAGTGDFLPNELLIALFDQHPTAEKLGPPTRLPSLHISRV